MKTFTLENPKQISLHSISERMRIQFKNVPFQYSNSYTPLSDDDENHISLTGSNVVVTLKDDLAETDDILAVLKSILGYNLMPILQEYAKHFNVIAGLTIVETPPSSVSIHINGNPAGGLRLWTVENKPHEIEILVANTSEGAILGRWVAANKNDILKANVYVAGDLIKFITVLN